MNVTLNWTPGAGSTSQTVQYKLASASTWTTFSTVSGTATTETVTGLADNLIYDFKILTACNGGTSTQSPVVQKINIICPTVTVTAASTSLSYSFPEIGGSVTSYVVKLFNSGGTSELASQTPTGTTTLTGTFSSLTASTTYKIRVIPTAGSISKTDCAFATGVTLAPPTCNPPTGVTADLTPEP
jgi:trimeric autotransporter adhesin